MSISTSARFGMAAPPHGPVSWRGLFYLMSESPTAGGEGEAKMNLRALLGVELPISQAPMAGVQGSALAITVSNAGGLGSLPCAMLTPDAIRKELTAITSATSNPYNV